MSECRAFALDALGAHLDADQSDYEPEYARGLTESELCERVEQLVAQYREAHEAWGRLPDRDDAATLSALERAEDAIEHAESALRWLGFEDVEDAAAALELAPDFTGAALRWDDDREVPF